MKGFVLNRGSRDSLKVRFVNRGRLLSAISSVVLILGIISGVEYLIMVVLSQLHLNNALENVIDAASLALIVAFPVWRLVVVNREAQISDSHLQIYKDLVDQTLQGVMITDKDMQIEHVNAGFVRTTGYSVREVIGKTPRILQSGRQDAKFYRNMWSDVHTNGQWEGEIWNRRKDGKIYAEWLNIFQIKSPHDHVTHYVGIFTDITQHKMLAAELEGMNQNLHMLLNRDPLTNVYNRGFFDRTLKEEWIRHLREGSPLCLIMIDIDNFKDYNDQYGHVAGDGCLKTVSTVIHDELNRPGDIATRYGGEEFAVLLPNTGVSGGRIVAERIRLGVERLPMQQADTPGALAHKCVTISLGVCSLIPTADMGPIQLIECADEALYKAKGAGKNQVAVFDNPHI